MASVKKIYVDSRFGEGSGSQFNYELPESVTTTQDCVAWITDVSFPLAWHTIDVHNDRIYMAEESVAGDPNPIPHARIITIPHQDYTASSLVAALQTALNTNGAGAAQKHGDGVYSVTFDAQKFSLTVSRSAGRFYIFSFDQLRDSVFRTRTWPTYATRSSLPVIWAQMPMDFHYENANPKTANGVLRISTQGQYDYGTLVSTMVGGTMDLRPVHTVFLTSENFSSYKVIGPGGGLRSTIRRIPITESAKGLQHYDHSGHPEDYIECGGQGFKTLRFALRDSFGNVVDLHGSHICFSIVFGERPG